MKTPATETNASQSMLVHAGGVGIGLAVALVLYAGVIKPAQDARREVTEMSEELVDRTKQLEVMTQSINRYREESETLSEQLSGSVRLQGASQLNRYVQKIVDLAEQSRCKISEAKPGEYQGVSQDYGLVPINLKCDGRPEDIIGFLRTLHDTHRDTDVVSCSLSSQSAGTRSNATGVLSLRWYTLPGGMAAEPAHARTGGNDRAVGADRADGAAGGR